MFKSGKTVCFIANVNWKLWKHMSLKQLNASEFFLFEV